MDVNPILDSYGALKQIISIPTRRGATLELLLTDLHPFYYPPTTLQPLEVDIGKNGSDSDHDVILMSPSQNSRYKIERKMKKITLDQFLNLR